MKLYVLNRIEPASYDEARSMVVRARSPKAARKIASGFRGDEGTEAWLDPTTTTCEELKTDGPEKLIVCDFFEA